VIAVMALIFVLSAQPGLRVSNDNAVDAPLRQLAHVVIYAALAALLVRALAWRGEVTVTVMAVAFGLALLYGVTDELHQSFVPDRTGKAADLVWDGAGALIGVVVARLTWPIVRRWS
jgi:VanZ family protein